MSVVGTSYTLQSTSYKLPTHKSRCRMFLLVVVEIVARPKLTRQAERASPHLGNLVPQGCGAPLLRPDDHQLGQHGTVGLQLGRDVGRS